MAELETSGNGLSEAEAEKRLAVYGKNLIAERKGSTLAQLIWRQYQSPLVLILIFGAGISIFVKEWTDATIILAIIFGSTMLGFTHEYRASAAVRRLRQRLALKATVLREGRPQTIEAQLVVPGDIVLLSAGNLVPADGVVLEARDFLVSQAALTGESFPVEKSPGRAPAGATPAERNNSVFLGTSVRSGAAKVLAVATGRNTELAAIAGTLAEQNAETEFERGLRKSVSGMSRLAKRGVLVRRLDAIENLGIVDILCTDKTGTLTKGVVEISATVDVDGASAAFSRSCWSSASSAPRSTF